MAVVPNPPLVPVEAYLETSYPDGDREYIDGLVVERNLGTPDHSELQGILIEHLRAFRMRFGIVARPECRVKVQETRYRVPDVIVMQRPFRESQRVVLEAPLIVIEILSPDDRLSDAIQRFRDYESLGVPNIVLMDPVDRATFLFVSGDLVRRDLTGFEVPGKGTLPFDSRELLARLDQE
jgi:Uma2 family endonuclease